MVYEILIYILFTCVSVQPSIYSSIYVAIDEANVIR